MQQNPIYKIIKEFEKYKDTKDDMEILNDISIIDNMINNVIEYNELIVNDIRNKYQNELQFLADLEQSLRSFQVNESTSSSRSNIQYLLNTRHSLVRVQVKRILERKGKKMLEEDLINNNNENLYEKFVLAMNS